MDPVITLEGVALNEFLAEIRQTEDKPGHGINKLSIHVDGEQVKYKINEHMWSHPVGKKREDY